MSKARSRGKRKKADFNWRALRAAASSLNKSHVKSRNTLERNSAPRRARGNARGNADALPLYLTREQAGQVIHALPARSLERLFVVCLWSTGARVSELLALRVSDIRFEERTVRLPTLKRRRQVSRLVPLEPDVLGELAVYLSSHWRFKTTSDDPLIFDRSRGWAWLVVQRGCLEAGIDRRLAHPHAFRHGHVVHALKAGVPMTAIQDTVGHASIETTAHYGRLSLVDRREAYHAADFKVGP
jgi:integrase